MIGEINFIILLFGRRERKLNNVKQTYFNNQVKEKILNLSDLLLVWS